MASIAKKAFDRAAKHVNNVLGDSYTYHRFETADEIPDLMITVNRNKKVKDEFNNLIGYRIEGSILKSELPDRPAPRDTIIDADGNKLRVGEVTIENVSKWYVDLEDI